MFFVLLLILLGPAGSLPTKYSSMNNQPCLVRLKLIDLNNYFPFMIALDRRNGGCDIDEETFDGIFVLRYKKTKTLKYLI